MRYDIPIDFDGALFVATCLTNGVVLEKSEAHQNPDGYMIQSGDDLVVSLDPEVEDKRAVVDNAISDQGGSRA